jgi:hypothetical protein
VNLFTLWFGTMSWFGIVTVDFYIQSEGCACVCESEHVHSVVYYNRFILCLFTFLINSERLHYVYVDVNMESESEPVHSVV